MNIVNAYVLLRRDTAQNLRLSNPLLMEGEACWEMDTNKVKIGDGITKYNALPYFAGNVEELLLNYYTKDEITSILNTELVKKADVTTTYTKEEVDLKIPTKTSELTNDSGFLTEHQPLKTINNQSIVGNGNIEIEGGGVTPEQVEEIVDGKGYATEQWVKGQGYLTEHQDISGKVDRTELAPVATSGDYNDLENKPDIPSIEGLASEQWVEDKGYLTQHQPIKTFNGESLVGEGDIKPTWNSITDKPELYTKSEVDAKIPVVNNATIKIKQGDSESEFTLNQDNDLTIVLPGESGGATWGLISGTISSQSDLQNALDAKADSTDIPTKVSELENDANYISSIPSEYVTESELDTKLSGYAAHVADTTIHVTSQDKENWDGKTTMSDVEAKGYITSDAIKDKADKSYVDTELGKKANQDTTYTKTEVDNLDNSVKDWVEDKGYLTEHQDISGKADKSDTYTKQEVDALIASAETGVTKEYVDGEIEKVEGNIPTKTSQLTNDSGYITEHQSLDNYYTKEETDNAITTATDTLEGEIGNKVDTSTYNTKIGEIDTALEGKADKGDIPSLDGYATQVWVEGKGYLTKVPAGYATEEWVEGKGYIPRQTTFSGTQAQWDAILNKEDYWIALITE